jgi:hypothetical protein
MILQNGTADWLKRIGRCSCNAKLQTESNANRSKNRNNRSNESSNNKSNWGLVQNESVRVVMQNCKQRATQTRAKTEIMATTKTAAAVRASTMRGARMAGKKVPYHCGDKSQNCGFCVSKLESTTGTMLYSHLGRYIVISIQTNLGKIYVHYLECSFH